jgi:hypothetical protein
MHKKLFKEHFGDKYIDKKKEKGTDIKYNILPDEKGNYKVKIYHPDSNDDREIP